jgi:crotonobetainyl-CoA:carnitine CoA-transferase CaiB-like acyl-CoA transferase
MNRGPLDGVKVVELGNAIGGPMCSMLLGDMGAEVIKVEPPNKGDDSRYYGSQVKGESPYFLQYNRNKKSITLNLKHEDGRRILSKLVERSDILVENFRPGTLERLGFSFEKTRTINPGIIYCSVSGFGQTGPYSDLKGYDPVIQAMSGIMQLTGEENGPPLRVGLPVTDIMAALYSAFSVVAALFSRERTGKGQRIDVSLFESGIAAVAQWITISSLTGKPARRFGNRYPLLAPYEPFETRDSPILVAVGNEELWVSFCKAIGREELTTDGRFRSNAERIIPENRAALNDLIEGALQEKTAGEWLEILWKAGIPCGRINEIESLAGDPHLGSRGVFTSVEHPSLGKLGIVAPMPKLSETPGSVRLAPPTLGQHTSEILLQLGFSSSEIAEFRRNGAV